MRMVYVDIPQPNGKMQRKLVWYMVYRVRNLGGHIKPRAERKWSLRKATWWTPTARKPA